MLPAFVIITAEIGKKVQHVVVFSIVKLTFSKSTVWIAAIKISQDKFQFFKVHSKIYIWFSTLLRRPGNVIMPRILEIIVRIEFAENL